MRSEKYACKLLKLLRFEPQRADRQLSFPELVKGVWKKYDCRDNFFNFLIDKPFLSCYKGFFVCRSL